MIDFKSIQDPYKTIEISVPEMSQIFDTLMPDENPAGVYILPKISNCSRERQKNQ